MGGGGGSDKKSVSAPFRGIPRLQEPDLVTTGLAGVPGRFCSVCTAFSRGDQHEVGFS